MKQANTAIYLDLRRKKKNGKYPIKLRIYANFLEVAKLYATGDSATEEEFDKLWNGFKPRHSLKMRRIALQELEARAIEIIDGLEEFSFEAFELRFLRKRSQAKDVFFHFERKIKELKDRGQIASAEVYQCALKSIIEFELRHNDTADRLRFSKVDPKWLEEYEMFMLTEGRSLTTVGIYLRSMRAVFNAAIGLKDITSSLFPFGKGKYVIPQPSKLKKSLSREELGVLFHGQPQNKLQQKAKDLFFLSYSLNGMNLADIAQLRWKHIQNGQFIHFVRQKTANSTRSKLKEIRVPVSEFAKTIFNDYGSKKRKDEELIFDIHLDARSDDENRKNRKILIRSINQHLQRYSKHIGLDKQISYQTARHSFATNAIQQGASMEFVSESLGHSSLKTTQNYFSGFDDKAKVSMSNKLMDL